VPGIPGMSQCARKPVRGQPSNRDRIRAALGACAAGRVDPSILDWPMVILD